MPFIGYGSRYFKIFYFMEFSKPIQKWVHEYSELLYSNHRAITITNAFLFKFYTLYAPPFLLECQTNPDYILFHLQILQFISFTAKYFKYIHNTIIIQSNSVYSFSPWSQQCLLLWVFWVRAQTRSIHDINLRHNLYHLLNFHLCLNLLTNLLPISMDFLPNLVPK